MASKSGRVLALTSRNSCLCWRRRNLSRPQPRGGPNMDIHTLLERLFSSDHEVKFDGCYFSGVGHTPKGDVAIIGTTDAAPIGVELAYRMAGEVLAIVRKHPR